MFISRSNNTRCYYVIWNPQYIHIIGMGIYYNIIFLYNMVILLQFYNGTNFKILKNLNVM